MRFLLLLLLLTWDHAQGEDWPQFLGPSRNGVYSGPAPSAAWAKSGPAMVWKIDVGQGFSAPVVARGGVPLLLLLRDASEPELRLRIAGFQDDRRGELALGLRLRAAL